jgi:hypothetical protein
MGTGRCGVRIRPDYEVGESSYKEKYAYCIGIFRGVDKQAWTETVAVQENGVFRLARKTEVL